MKRFTPLSRRVAVAGLLALCLSLAPAAWALQARFETNPTDHSLTRFRPVAAPAPAGPLLKDGDRLAICGDSITEQKMYSRTKPA